MSFFNRCVACCAVVALTLICTSLADDKKSDHATADKAHVVVKVDKLKWGPAPPGLPKGAEVAVLDGDPSVSGKPFVIRVKVPDGYKVMPHWHQVDESVTVLKGTFMMGTGEKFDQTKAEELAAGSYTRMPKEMRHFAIAKGETIIQLHGIGPFEITYVNAADDPRKTK